MLRCDAVVFDLDGVLVDSSRVVDRHWRAWAAGHGIPFARIAAVHHGRPTVETIRLVAPALDATAEAYRMEMAEGEDTDGLVAAPGAHRLLGEVTPARWAIVTSGTRRTATMRLAHVGLPEPDVLITADDVSRGKPAPDPYLLAAERLGIPPVGCVVVEDAPAGVTSARVARMRVIGVASTMAPGALAGADVIVKRLDDLALAPSEGAAAGAGALIVTWRATA